MKKMPEFSNDEISPSESETPATNPPEVAGGPQSSSETFDSSKMRNTKPGIKRLTLTLTLFFSLILGLPFLLKSVEIYRSPLPFKEMDSLSSVIESEPMLFPCRFQAVFLGFDDINNVGDLEASIADQMRSISGRDQSCGSCGKNFSVSVSIELENGSCLQSQGSESPCSWQCGALKEGAINENWKDNDIVDEMLDNALFRSQKCSASNENIYSILLAKRDEEARAVVGKHRHGWIVGKVAKAEAVERVAEIFVNMFINGGKKEGSIHGEFMPVGADGRVVLSFSLLNADPHDWVYDWDFQRVHKILFAPVVEALAPVAEISIESQILYHTPKSFVSRWDDQRSTYIYDTKDLPFFVNSNEWHLDTSTAAGGRSKILHFVAYIPSAKECPLSLRLPHGHISITNGFISPMWGGITVWNPSDCSSHSENEHHSQRTIPYKDLVNIAEIFLGQLRQLFGLTSESLYVGSSGKVDILANEKGFTEWELDALSRQHTCFNLQSCGNTLGSLSRLVQSLPRMIITDEIGKQVESSLSAAKVAQINASLGFYENSVVSSRVARSLAEDAFYHPSIMSISYYSYEHCFAVYSPFFLPVALHVLLATIKEWRRYKLENRKYLAWKSEKRLHSD